LRRLRRLARRVFQTGKNRKFSEIATSIQLSKSALPISGRAARPVYQWRNCFKLNLDFVPEKQTKKILSSTRFCLTARCAPVSALRSARSRAQHP
jgi:hypothetical protein